MLPHSLFWSMLFNLGTFIACSLLSEPSEGVAEQAVKFVDVFEAREEPVRRKRMSRAPAIVEFIDLMTKFIGEKQAHAAYPSILATRRSMSGGAFPSMNCPF
ncbi:hypothetical protein [Geotalea toluenoxydans]|uniref:hypothetical protein n=1 Tax=Geotalea toluenoxydans TaxID=421624 RepID=UPI000AA08C7C|nr:hypothetical protein [Geotalea toluenoxydans]